MPYDTWPCLPKSYWEDTDQVPDPDFTLLLEGSYFTLFVSGNTLYGTVIPPTGDDNSFYCRVYSDSDRTIEITTGDYTGQPYRMEFFGGWKFENRNRFDERDFSGNGRWRSNPVTIYASGGRFEGTWVVEDYVERSVTFFDGVWVANNLGVYGLTVTEGAGGTLPAGTYTVHVAAVDSSARVGGASFETITVSANATIVVDWLPTINAVSYNVYLDCALKESGIIPTDYTIGDITLEDPADPPPQTSDPAIPPDDDPPIVIIIPPGDPEELPGGKVIGTDPDTGNDYVVTVTPGVPVDPAIDGVVTEIRTEQVGDCLETKTYTDGVLTAWTKLCTDPVTGQKSFCEGLFEGTTTIQENLDVVFTGAPYPIVTTAESPTIDNYPISLAPGYTLPKEINSSSAILYVNDQLDPIDPDSEGSIGEISVKFEGGTPDSVQFVGDSTNSGWADSPDEFTPLEVGTNNIRVEVIETGLPEELPGSEWYLKVDITSDIWNFICEDVIDPVEPTVGSCRFTSSFISPFTTGGRLFGDRITETQCNADPLNLNWADLSHLSDLLLKVLGINAPIPRASSRKTRIEPRDRQDIHDPRLWTFPLPNGNAMKHLEDLYLLNKVDGSQIPTELKKYSAIFNRAPGQEF